MVWFALAMMVASLVLQVATASKSGTDASPSTLSDFDMPQTDDGTPQAVLFGEAWSKDWQILGYGDFRTSAVKAKQAKK